VNLRPSSLQPPHHREGDGVSESAGVSLIRQQSSASEASTTSAATDHTETLHRGTETGDRQVMARVPQSDVMRDKDASGHQLKRGPASDSEPGVQAKRLSDGAVGDDLRLARSAGGSQAAMDVESSARAGQFKEPGTRRGEEIVREERDVRHGERAAREEAEREITVEDTDVRHSEPTTSGEMEGLSFAEPEVPPRLPEVPPRLMETGVHDEPMVIEFSAAATGHGSSGEDDVRAGHKRARVNSGTVHNDVIKKSFIRRPVMFYGNSFLSHYGNSFVSHFLVLQSRTITILPSVL